MMNLLLLSLETCSGIWFPAVQTLQTAALLPGPDGQCPSVVGIPCAHTLQQPKSHITTSEAVEESLWGSCRGGGEGADCALTSSTDFSLAVVWMEPSNLTVGLCLSSTTAKTILRFMHNISPRMLCHSRCYFSWFFIHVIGEPCSNPTFHTNSSLKVLLSAIIPAFFLCKWVSHNWLFLHSIFFLKYLSLSPSQKKKLTFQAFKTSPLPRVFLSIFTTINFSLNFLFHYRNCVWYLSPKAFFPSEAD